MELGLKGRTAILTGGSMGIGKAVGKGLAGEHHGRGGGPG